MLSTLPLKTKLSALAIVALLICGICTATVSLISGINRLDQTVQKQLLNTVHSYNDFFSSWLGSKENALKSLSREIKKREIQSRLLQVSRSGGFENAFLAFTDGSQINAHNVQLPPGNDDPRQWQWYQDGLRKNGSVTIDNPGIAAASKSWVVSLGVRIGQKDPAWVLGVDVKITDLLSHMRKTHLPGEGHLLMLTDTGDVFAFSDTDQLNAPITSVVPGLDQGTLKRLANSQHVQTLALNGQEHYVLNAPISNTRFSTLVVVDKHSVMSPLYATLTRQCIMIFFVALGCALLFFFVSNVIFAPLRHVTSALKGIASGEGDLTQRIHIRSEDEIGELAKHFNAFVDSQCLLVEHLREQAQQLNTQANHSATLANQSVTKLQQQQTDVGVVASAITEMAAAAEEIASYADSTNQAVLTSSEHSAKGQSTVQKTRGSIHELAEELTQTTQVIDELCQHATAIGGILTTIQGVAEQTNLLALNAAIEAARAGQQGRGFAVVADEVRVLSQRTHASTDEIRRMLDDLQAISNKAVAKMQHSSELAQTTVSDAESASQALTLMNQSVSDITDMMLHTATAARQQTKVTEELTQNTVAIKTACDALAHDAESASEQASQLNHCANAIGHQVAAYKV